MKLNALFPPRLDNGYHGKPLALWFFFLLTGLTLVRSLIHILAADGGAMSIATIPLDEFTANGAAAVVHLFALWGLSQLIVALLYVAALVRWRSLIPLLYLLALLEYSVRLILTLWKPMELHGTAPGAIGNYLLIPLLLFMLILSLLPRKTASGMET